MAVWNRRSAKLINSVDLRFVPMNRGSFHHREQVEQGIQRLQYSRCLYGMPTVVGIIFLKIANIDQ